MNYRCHKCKAKLKMYSVLKNGVPKEVFECPKCGIIKKRPNSLMIVPSLLEIIDNTLS